MTFDPCTKCKGRGWLPSRKKTGWPSGCPTCHGMGIQTTEHQLSSALGITKRRLKKVFNGEASESSLKEFGERLRKVLRGGVIE